MHAKAFDGRLSDWTTFVMCLQAMFAAQLVGMLSGCVLAPATFQMFVAGQPNLGEPGSEYPAPFAQVYRNMAVVGVGGTGELGKNCLWVSNLNGIILSRDSHCLGRLHNTPQFAVSVMVLEEEDEEEEEELDSILQIAVVVMLHCVICLKLLSCPQFE